MTDLTDAWLKKLNPMPAAPMPTLEPKDAKEIKTAAAAATPRLVRPKGVLRGRGSPSLNETSGSFDPLSLHARGDGERVAPRAVPVRAVKVPVRGWRSLIPYIMAAVFLIGYLFGYILRGVVG